MESGKTLTSLAVILAFWMAIVLLLLLTNGELNDRAVATPVAADTGKHDTATRNTPIPEIPSPEAPEETFPVFATEISGKILPGETLDQAMRRLNTAAAVRSQIIKGFAETLDFKALQPGDRFTIQLDENNSLVQAVYTSGLLNIHILKRGEDGTFLANRQEIPLECRVERISGKVESSLYAAFTAIGEKAKLVQAFADIFASKIDFNTETRTGDRFELLVEKYHKDSIFVGYGRILAARYRNSDVTFEGYYFASENTPEAYFDEEGKALGTWFIRSPLPVGRVTSRFTLRRKHPIDGVVRPHLGVDLAAPVGTPIMAAADGKVEYIGRKGGFGNTIILHHNGGYKTYYGHLHGYKKGLRKGSFVNQKEIIGYVGSTGISTGPHLDYRIQHNGVFKNPFGIKFKAKTVLQEEELALFRRQMTRTAKIFNADTDEKILQVRNVVMSDKNRISFL
jgi:murein DD-endopeptidase MepM/ murein hydrolase activator NlpD